MTHRPGCAIHHRLPEVCFGLGVAVYLLGRVGTTVVPPGPQYHFEADVRSAIALASAADVREDGVFIGRVSGIKRVGTLTGLQLSIAKKYGPIYRNATVLIRAKSVAGENYVQLDPGTQVPEGLRVDDHAHVDGLAALDPRHHPDQRVLEDVGSRHGRITSSTMGARCSRCST